MVVPPLCLEKKQQPKTQPWAQLFYQWAQAFAENVFTFYPLVCLFVWCILLLLLLCLIFFNKDLLSLCLIRPLQAGCTDPVPQTELVSWIQQGCKPLRPPLSQLLCRAMPLHMMPEQAVHGGTSLCKKNNFAHRFLMPLYIDHNSMRGAGGGGGILTPHKQDHHKAPWCPSYQSRPQTSRLAHGRLHAHEWQIQNSYFRDAFKAQRSIKRKGQRSSAHPVHWETVRRNASSAGGVRIGNQSRISRESWAVDLGWRRKDSFYGAAIFPKALEKGVSVLLNLCLNVRSMQTGDQKSATCPCTVPQDRPRHCICTKPPPARRCHRHFLIHNGLGWEGILGRSGPKTRRRISHTVVFISPNFSW